jgi:hypothetical protein
MEVDKNNIFLEENEDNNFTAVPVTLTLQNPANSNQLPDISSNNSNNLCEGQTLTLTATAGTSFLWSTGETTQTITVNQPGSYTCEVTNYCGTNTSEPFIVNNVMPDAPVTSGDSVCVSGSMTLVAEGSGDISWFDANGNFVGSGDTLVTPNLTQTTTYFAQNTDVYLDSINAEPYTNGIGGGGFVTSDQYEIFNSYIDFNLKSVLVYSQSAGAFTIELQDQNGVMIETMVANVVAGSNRIQLNFNVPIGTNLRLVGKNIGTSGLYRNNNSATYPYELPNILSIVGASAGASYYYFFYDWQVVTENSTCSSALTPVNAVVNSCAGLGEDILFKRSIVVSPNPNNGEFSIQFNTQHSGELTYEMYSIIGETVYSEKANCHEGLNHTSINTKNLSKGMYIFAIEYEGKKYTTRLIIHD